MSNNKAKALKQVGYNSEFEKWKKSLNKFDIEALEKEYLKVNKLKRLDYKEFDVWLLEGWEKKK